jgi:predicted ArsR family transcriptional regulator
MTGSPSKSYRGDLVAQALRDSNVPLTIKDIAGVTQLAEISVRRHLRSLRDAGVAVRVPRSRHAPDAPKGRTPDRYCIAGSTGA